MPLKLATWKSLRLVSMRCGLVLASLAWGSAGSIAMAGEMACVVKPYMEVSVGPPVEGIIQAVKVDRGDWVTKGQILVTLEASVEEATVALAKAKADAEATIKSSEAKVGFSTRKLERAMELYKTSSIAKHEVDEAQTEKVVAEMEYLEAVENKRIAELEWQRATAALNLHRIQSPLTGIVVERLLSPGELARQTPILKLAQIDPLRVEVFAPLSWLGKLKPGMKAEVHTGHSEAVHSAKVTVVNEVVDNASGTFGVRLEMPNPNNKLQAGLSCTVNFNGTR